MYISIPAIEEAIGECDEAVARTQREIGQLHERMHEIRCEADAHRNAARTIRRVAEDAMPARDCEGPVDWAAIEIAFDDQGVDEADFDMFVREYYDRQGHPEAYYDKDGNEKPNPFKVFCALVQHEDAALYGVAVERIERVLRGTWAYRESSFGAGIQALSAAADHCLAAFGARDAA